MTVQEVIELAESAISMVENENDLLEIENCIDQIYSTGFFKKSTRDYLKKRLTITAYKRGVYSQRLQTRRYWASIRKELSRHDFGLLQKKVKEENYV